MSRGAIFPLRANLAQTVFSGGFIKLFSLSSQSCYPQSCYQQDSNTTEWLSNTTEYSLLGRVFSSEKKKKSLPLISHILIKTQTCLCVSLSQV